MESINFFILHFSLLTIANFVWEFFVLFMLLKIFKEGEVLFTKKFYLFLFTTTIFNLLINRLFEFSVKEAPLISDIWNKIDNIEKTGFVLLPTVILMYIYFSLGIKIFGFKANKILFLSLLLGIATAPWLLLV